MKIDHVQRVTDAFDFGDNTLMNFYAAQVGKPMDSNREFVVLTEWEETLHKGLLSAKKINAPPWVVEKIKKQVTECAMYLELWAKGS